MPTHTVAPGLDRSSLTESIPANFARRLAGYATRLAVSSRERSLSYAALDDMAGTIAHAIVEHGGTENEPVILLLEPDISLVAAVLGTLKAGKICVPVRPAQPLSRIQHVLDDTRARLIVTDGDHAALAHQLCGDTRRVIEIGLLQSSPDSGALAPPHSPDRPAYILYTSGSTGEQRGVVHSHESLLHLAMGSTGALGITCADRIALMPSSSFIGAARSIFAALLNGASLHPFDVNREGLSQFAEWLADEEITIYHFVPTFFRSFVASLKPETRFPKLRLIYLGGEPVRRTDVESFRQCFAPDAVLVNGYGATETGAIRRYIVHSDTPVACSALPVGYPTADKEVLILDEDGLSLGVDCVGEIAVKSRFLASGYWRQDQATRSTFVPASKNGEEVVFRTGDLGRLSTDGCLEHLGRRDSQVKIRGHRIDVVAIELVLLSIPSTTDVAVVASEDVDGEVRLVAYVASSARGKMKVDHVRRVLARSLPAYSIPASFVFLDAIPRTSRGKLDKRALPVPSAGRPDLHQPFIAPRTSLEKRLARLWESVLEVEGIGIDDDFFDLGGDSIRATQLLNRVEKLLGEDRLYLYMTAVFDGSSVRKFARYLERHYPEAIPWIDEGVGASPEPGDIRPKQAPAGACIRESNVSRMRRLIASTYPERYCDWTGNERPIVFVLCSSRSGSTLLRTMLGGHPRLFAPPELRLLGYNTLAEREAAHLGENAMMLEGAIRALMQLHGRTAREAREHMVQLAAEKATTLDYYGLLQDSLDGAILVDKTPSYALHPPILDRTKSCFENARYIHLVRHPLGAIRSSAAIRMDLVSPFRRHVASAGELAEILWLISHQNILRFLARMPAHRQWRVKFEELVRDPEPAMRDVCRLLNLDFHPKMLRPYDDPHERMTDGIRPETRMIGDIRFHEHTRIDASNAERWKAHAREYPLSAMTWDLAESLGYERL